MKLTFEEVKKRFQSSKKTLLTQEYKNDATFMSFNCDICHTIGKTTVNHIHCNECARRQRESLLKPPILEPKYGKLKITGQPYRIYKWKQKKWWVTVECDCGHSVLAKVNDLKSCHTKSCGKCKKQRKDPLSLDLIVYWISRYFSQNGSYPISRGCEAIQEMEGYTWRGVDAALRQGHRGLPGKFSLAEFIVKHFGAVNKTNKKAWTKKDVIRWIKDFYKRNNLPPHQDSGIVNCEPEFGRLTWESINKQFEEKHNDSLPRFILRHFGENAKICFIMRQQGWFDWDEHSSWKTILTFS